MQTQPLTKSELIMHLKEATELLEKGLCSEGTVSWTKTSVGTYETIMLVMASTDAGIIPLTVGDVNG